MKFDKIKKFWAVLENLAQNEIFDHAGPARMKFGKIQKLQAVLKIWLKSRFLTTPDLWKKFWKKQNFQSHWIFDSKLTCLTTTDLGRLKSLTTQDMQRMKVGKIQKFLVALKIWRKNWFWEFWPLGTCEGWNFAKSRNFQSRWKFGLNMRVLTTANHQRMKFDKIHKNFDLCWKFDSKMRFLTMTSRPAKDEVWQNPEILSHVENFAQNWDFNWPLRTCEGYEIWQNPEILSRVLNLS